MVGLESRCHARADLPRQLLVVADAVNFPGADRPAPDVQLILRHAAEVDPRIGVRHRVGQVLAIRTLHGAAVGEDIRYVVEARRLLDAPVETELEVAVFLLGPEILVTRGFRLGIVVDHALEHFPMSVVALRNDPPAEVLSVEKGLEALRRRVRGRERQAGKGGEQEEDWAKAGGHVKMYQDPSIRSESFPRRRRRDRAMEVGVRMR